MSSVTREDMRHILQFGIHIARIDGVFDVWEKRILAKFADAMKLTETERAEMMATELSLAKGLDALSGQDARQLLIKTLCAVAHSDGVPHDAEIDFIQKVIKRLGGQVFMLPVQEWGVYEQEVLDVLGET